MSPDWSAKVEPAPYSKLDSPQTLNLYAYVGNNPMDRVDLVGHMGTEAERKAQETEDWVNGSGSVVGQRPGDDPSKKNPPVQQKNGASAATGLAASVGGPLKLLGKIMDWFDDAQTLKEGYDDATELAGWKKVLKAAQSAYNRDTNRSYQGWQGDPDVDRTRMDLATAHMSYLLAKMAVAANGIMSDSMTTKMTEMLEPDLKPNIDAAQQRANQAWSEYVAQLNRDFPQ